jgi:hypothetical protein
MVRNDNTVKYFFNEKKAFEGTDSNLGKTSPDRLTIGCGWHDNENRYMNYITGDIDEFRLSRVSRSNDWMKTSYNTIINAFDGGFFSVGPEETPP